MINSNLKDIIGSKKIVKNKKISNIYKISTDNNFKIKKISKKINLNHASSEVIGINKFSFKTQIKYLIF